MLLTIFWFLVALGVLVTIHEFGHFYVARRVGVKVLRFSIGFGKPFFTWHDRHGTEFAIAAIPLGGYVKMLDEREGTVPEEERHMAFNRKSVWARIAVVAAGPVANFILAVVLFWATFLPADINVAPVVGEVAVGSIAEQAGLESGQEIVAVDGNPTPSWQALGQALLARLGESGEISFSVKYPGSDLEYQSHATLQGWLKGEENPDPIAGLGLTLFRPKIEPVVASVADETPAAQSGVQAGDRFIAINGQGIENWQGLVETVSANPGRTLDFTLLRNGSEVNMAITPAAVKDQNGASIGQIGIAPVIPTWPEEMLRPYNHSLGGAFVAAVDKTWETTGFIFLSLKKLLVGEISTKSLSGPFTIAKVAGDSAEAGWIVFVSVLASLSVNLGVLNLLPIPVLDGGHLLFYFIEAIKGKPVSQRVQMIGYQVGLFLVAGIMVLAFYNDIVRIFQGRLFGLPV
ncbi:RIP metalloprotease RseP [Halioxenophilus aromaticivorans]|uniref:Zinc metalloprotease n=1 Tax=Halioxenophilus aromaticivorans TaxID=1306992 RepID=A0AAV3TY13_9ALTE